MWPILKPLSFERNHSCEWNNEFGDHDKTSLTAKKKKKKEPDVSFYAMIFIFVFLCDVLQSQVVQV